MVKMEDAVIARIEKGGHTFELLVDPHLAMEVKHGKEIELASLLAIERVFKDARKGDEQGKETIQKVFLTADLKEIAKKIIQNGEVQLTTEQRRMLLEKKKSEIFDFISRNAINPQTKTPHPPQRIQNAMEQAKVHVDAFKSTEEQIEDIVKALRPIIPISLEKIDFAVKIPAEHAGKCSSIIHKFEMKREQWLNDGSLAAEFQLPAGLKQDLLNKLNSVTHGDITVKIVG
ncbi:MAG: ribosome assembly factor SBDS [Candidatus Diapherotrites archaeon]|nr:ribosome assembly factor SBDS [Candidatus Diapherotrites archaeon]